MKRSNGAGCEQLLRQLLARNPRLTLDQIRKSHPVFKAMSFDQLSVRLARILDQTAWA
jgi:hypothetical protein